MQKQIDVFAQPINIKIFFFRPVKFENPRLYGAKIIFCFLKKARDDAFFRGKEKIFLAVDGADAELSARRPATAGKNTVDKDLF